MAMFNQFLRERRRSRVVDQLGVLDDAARPDGLDPIVEAAADAFGAPISILSIIRGDHQWFKAARGIKTRRIPRADGFCTLVLDRDGILECCDPAADPRFASLPAVTGKRPVRYYIGAPILHSCGTSIGALCVADTTSRLPTSAEQKAFLAALARRASILLEAGSEPWFGRSAR